MQLTTQLLCLSLAPLFGEPTPSPGPDVLAGTPPATTATTTARGPSLHWGDFDRDGALDVFVATPSGQDRLFRNAGLGELVDVTSRTGLELSTRSRTATWFDFDSDGDLDLFTASDTSASRLWSNDGQGLFTDVTKEAGLASEVPDLEVQTLDFDGDGHTDLQRSTALGDRLFKNEGDGHFVEVELAELLASAPGKPGLPQLPPAIQGKQPAAAAAGTLGQAPTGQLGATSGPGAISTNPFGPATLASSTLLCAGSVEDIMSPGTCIPLSTIPTLGMIYPLGLEFNIDGAGQVGIGTTTPGATLDVVGDIRTSGQLTSLELASPPIKVLSSQKVSMLNVDLLDGFDSSDFSQLGSSISGAEIEDLTITGSDIADSTIGSSKLAIASVSAAKIQDGAVLSTKIQDGAVVASKLGTDSVTTTKIKDGSITTSKLVTNSVTSNEILNGTVSSNDLAANSVQSIHIFPDTISAVDIASGGVLSDEIGDSTILNVDINPLAGILGTKIAADFGAQTVQSSGTTLIPAMKGTGSNGPTNGYMGVQGVSDFDGVDAADWLGEEIGIAGISTGASVSDNYGVTGLSNNIGVRGQGDTAGVQGLNTVGAGVGVHGRSTSTNGFAYGVMGELTTSGSTGVGVRGEAPFYGVFGEAFDNGVGTLGRSTLGIGVYGEGTNGVLGSATGTGDGVTGYSNGSGGTGVHGNSTATFGIGIGVHGESQSTSGRGVRGEAFSATGVNYGVQGRTHSASGWGVVSFGSSGATGQKNFIQPHPTDPSQELHFFSLEGNESGTYFRGSNRTVGGMCVITVPEEFRMVSAAQGLTVQLTAVGGPALLWTETRDLDQVVVRSTADVEFDYTVNGVRRGFEEVQIFAANNSFVPETRNVPFGTQYPDSYRNILVENGILNADYTPNESVAAQNGWVLVDPNTSVDSAELPALTRLRELQQQSRPTAPVGQGEKD